jgi:hypothetical protein
MRRAGAALAKCKIGRPRLVEDDDDDLDDLPPPPGRVEPPPAWDCKPIAKQVQAVLDAVEAPPIDKETRLTLQRYLYRRNRYGAMFRDDDDFGADGRGYITLLLRTILESEGNQDAVIEPIVSAVASSMRPIWVRRGLEWIAAFDRIPLMDILNKLRELDLFTEKELEAALRDRHRASVMAYLRPGRCAATGEGQATTEIDATSGNI